MIKTEELNRRGREAARIRDAVCLPYAWNIPSDEQIGKVLCRIGRIADAKRVQADRLTLEAATLSMLVIQTGQQASALLKLRAGRWEQDSPINMPLGLNFIGSDGFIVLPSLPTKHLLHGCATLGRVILPMSGLLRRLIDRLDPLAGSAKLLFQCDPDELISRANLICRGCSKPQAKASKAIHGLNAMRRWLRFQLRMAAKGDPIMCALLGLNSAGVERTLSYYITVQACHFWEAYCKALEPELTGIAAVSPKWLENIYFGRGSCPDPEALSVCVAQLKEVLQRPIFDPNLSGKYNMNWRLGPLAIAPDRHHAMMLYTYAFATFGTGQRYIGSICSAADVDPETGFSWVTEKGNERIGASGSRGVYHSKSVRSQLGLYENYLDALQDKLAEEHKWLASQLAALRAEGGLTFFEIVGDQIIRLKPSRLCVMGKAVGWRYTANAGRHWLRSKLTFVVPGDALASQFGHFLSGFDVWGIYSGLQPALVGQALEPAVEALLEEAGFEPAGAPCKTQTVSSEPDFESDPDNRRARVGQILASAIWNGAMLNPLLEEELLEDLEDARSRKLIREWIQLDLDRNGGAERWKVDPQTQELLGRYARKKVSFTGEYPDSLLIEFLGSAANLKRFRLAAENRWRFLLPPMLWAKAVGHLDNKTVTKDRFSPGRLRVLRPRNAYKRRLKFERRSTGIQFESFFKSHWHAPKGKRVVDRKKQAYQTAIKRFRYQGFVKRMSPVELSMAHALIEQLITKRPRNCPQGFSGRTILGRIERIWRDFLPDSEQHEAWESTAIQNTHHEVVFDNMCPIPKVRANVAADIGSILADLPETENSQETKAKIEELPENRMHELLRPLEYGTLRQTCREVASGPVETSAYALCYRAGIRISELSTILESSFSKTATGRSELRLDHTPYRLLKTFQSRRRVPLDLFLDDDELQEFKEAISIARASKLPIGKRFGSTARKMSKKLIKVTNFSKMSAYPLRHSFATNCMAALLWPQQSDLPWPEQAEPRAVGLLDGNTMTNRAAFKTRLEGEHSLGSIGPHALASVLGHTSPHRTLYSYAHLLELILAQHLAQVHGSNSNSVHQEEPSLECRPSIAA